MKISTEKTSDDYLVLNSCGIEKLWDRDYYTIRKQGRADYHLIYIIEGKCISEALGRNVILSRGEMIVFFPGEKHRYEFKASDRPISAYIHFTGKGCGQLLKNLGFFQNRVLSLKKNNSIVNILKKMADEYQLKKPFYNEMCTAYLLEFFGSVGREIAHSKNGIHQKKQPVIDDVCKKMIEEYNLQNSIEYYADYCHLSTGRFYHIFKAATGVTPVEYINKIRIEKAKEILCHTNSTVSETAELTGFSDQNYFGRVFKRYVGTSPKKFSME